MKLYLARHGEYIAHGIHQLGSLSEKGKNDIEQLATFLQSSHIKVAKIFHSGKARAEETAQLLTKAFICSSPIALSAGMNPEDDVSAFAEVVNTWDEDVLLVGHLPFMGRLVGKLLVNNEDKEIVVFQPGSLVCLERMNHIKWVIHWMLNPEIVCNPIE